MSAFSGLLLTFLFPYDEIRGFDFQLLKNNSASFNTSCKSDFFFIIISMIIMHLCNDGMKWREDIAAKANDLAVIASRCVITRA